MGMSVASVPLVRTAWVGPLGGSQGLEAMGVASRPVLVMGVATCYL